MDEKIYIRVVNSIFYINKNKKMKIKNYKKMLYIIAKKEENINSMINFMSE